MRMIDADALGIGRCNQDIIPRAYAAGWNGVVNIISAAPTIDPVRHGRWIPNYGGHNIARCSACQKEQHVQEAFLKFWTYCPSCGAKMDKEDA